MRKNYIKDRAQAAVTYITEYGNTTIWSLENLVPLHKLMQHLQIVFARVDAVRKAVDEAIENDDEIRRKKCMRCLKPPKRFPVPEDMESEETATWINWIYMETQALLEDLNEEIKLQNTADDSQNISFMHLHSQHRIPWNFMITKNLSENKKHTARSCQVDRSDNLKRT